MGGWKLGTVESHFADIIAPKLSRSAELVALLRLLCPVSLRTHLSAAPPGGDHGYDQYTAGYVPRTAAAPGAGVPFPGPVSPGAVPAADQPPRGRLRGTLSAE